MKRVMCIYLPRWPLQRRRAASCLVDPEPPVSPSRKRQPERPLVIAQPHFLERAKVLLCCDRALQLGIRPGMPVAEAKAIEPALWVQDDDPPADCRALEQLAVWAERFSPIVGLEEGPAPECLLADVTGCASCFHGEDRLIQRALGELHEQHWQARAALADTIGAAWALAHHVRSWVVTPPGEAAQALLPLPVTALRLPDEVLETLAELGIERIGQLQTLPRSGLPGRLGPLVLARLDQALGRQPKLIVP
ncbi:MAG: DNA polymerase Y family protein, partial [Acidobacteria bacterium]|nr:DNA polymerase Y family protein [Acidobacteriota bacterium]